MGIFGNDKEQDARIDALESHVRAATVRLNTFVHQIGQLLASINPSS